jgi:hypothetical protein
MRRPCNNNTNHKGKRSPQANIFDMNARTFVAWSIALMTLGRIADVLVTYHFTPGLELEANPLASVFGLGWSPLLAANLIVLIAIAACSVYWCRHPLQYERSDEVHDLWTFASFACYRRVYPPMTFLGRRLLTPPAERAHTLHLVGAVMPITVAVMSAVAVLSWDALYHHQWEAYSWFYRVLWPVFPYGVVVPTMWIAALYFYKHEFRRYQQLCPAPVPATEVTETEPAVQ